jgi:hypothetical protein
VLVLLDYLGGNGGNEGLSGAAALPAALQEGARDLGE